MQAPAQGRDPGMCDTCGVPLTVSHLRAETAPRCPKPGAGGRPGSLKEGRKALTTWRAGEGVLMLTQELNAKSEGGDRHVQGARGTEVGGKGASREVTEGAQGLSSQNWVFMSQRQRRDTSVPSPPRISALKIDFWGGGKEVVSECVCVRASVFCCDVGPSVSLIQDKKKKSPKKIKLLQPFPGSFLESQLQEGQPRTPWALDAGFSNGEDVCVCVCRSDLGGGWRIGPRS